jgi:hypothetical protein
MTDLRTRDWVIVDGSLEPIDFDGFGDDRSPRELTDMVISAFSTPGDWVLDPFAGLGSTLLSAQALGRNAIGFEINPERAAWLGPRLVAPSRLIEASCQDMAGHDLPRFALAFTSPPYITVHLEDDPWGATYFADMRAIFAEVGRHMLADGKIVVEVSNILTEDGFRPLSGQFAAVLGEVLELEREIVRINSSGWSAGPGVGYSTLLVFRPMS